MKVYSFSKGGIDFEDNYAPGRGDSRLAFLPETAIIPLSSESGARACPVVEVGQHIEEGMLIARGQGAGSANIHSSIPGKLVKMIKWEPETDFLSEAFVIRLEGSFKKLGKLETKHPWAELSRFEINTLITENGVTEMDGLGRPLCEIFSEFDTVKERITLLIRCVFDDPWLAADYRLCKERADAVGEGALIAAKAAGADKIVFAVSADAEDLFELLIDAVNRCEDAAQFDVSAFFTGSRYPQSNDFEMREVFYRYEKSVSSCTEKPLILGPATAAAVYDAVVLRSPVLERYVAVGGAAVKHPAVIKARIGSRLRDVFAECGGFRGKPEVAARIVAAIGSPLMGRAVTLNEPITKTSCGVFAYAQKKHRLASFFPAVLKIKKTRKISSLLPAAVCISCGECRNVCPVRLDPEDIYKQIKNGKHDEVMIPLVSRCIGCGCCEAVCPSKLPVCSVITRAGFRGVGCA
ncbi:MAG: 4Fe-4S dicluster domain-containing protein [Spirochaetaceae bacterium]|jgi:electron transport complex protein RnfC|nr:4Fe-4S dicluster domain-containing protein [Spirochaetaceae bacterium]